MPLGVGERVDILCAEGCMVVTVETRSWSKQGVVVGLMHYASTMGCVKRVGNTSWNFCGQGAFHVDWIFRPSQFSF